jgi:4-amino-4-deoxy-L-arabinose transferase-like glycosyltransferase
MPRGLFPLAVAVLIAVGAAGIYTTRLGDSPIHMIRDEVVFALQAQSISSSGRDLSGRFLPLYFTEPEFPAGRDPMFIYATALVLKVLPFSPASARLAAALVGVVNCVLMFFIGRRLFGSWWMGAVSALVLAMIPAHFIHSRLGLSILFPMPFMLAWILGVLRYVETREPWRLGLAFALLACGIYGYLAAVVMTPIYCIALAALWGERRERLPWQWACVGYALPWIPMLLWQIVHPDRISGLATSYRVDAPSAQSLLGLFTYGGLRLRLDLWWTFFSPEFLFLSGDPNYVNSTRETGYFPIAFAVLLPLGALAIWRGAGGAIGRLSLFGLISSPLAAVLFGGLGANRLMFAIPFGALVAMFGLSWLIASPRWRARLLAALLLTAMIWQFVGFYRDYMGPYRVRSAAWFGFNLSGAMSTALAASEGGTIYISPRIPYAPIFWRFRAIQDGRAELIDAARYEEPGEFAPPGTLAVCPENNTECAPVGGGSWTALSVPDQPEGPTRFRVIRRD